MIRAKFEVRQNEEFGSDGLWFVGRPWAEPLPGMACAHDVLEHFARDKGTLEDELMAFGAAFHVRGNIYSAMKNRYGQRSIGEDFSSDLVMQTTTYGHNFIRPLLNTKPVDDEIEEEIRKCWASAKVEMALTNWDDPSIVEEQHHESFVGWVRRGYRRANQRYRGISPYMLCESFVLLEDALDKFLERADRGMRCSIAINPRRCWLDFKDLQYDHYPDY